MSEEYCFDHPSRDFLSLPVWLLALTVLQGPWMASRGTDFGDACVDMLWRTRSGVARSLPHDLRVCHVVAVPCGGSGIGSAMVFQVLTQPGIARLAECTASVRWRWCSGIAKTYYHRAGSRAKLWRWEIIRRWRVICRVLLDSQCQRSETTTKN